MPLRTGCWSPTARSTYTLWKLSRKSSACWKMICPEWSTSSSQRLSTVTLIQRTTPSILLRLELLMRWSCTLVFIYTLLFKSACSLKFFLTKWSNLLQQTDKFLSSRSAPKRSFWKAKQRWISLKKLQVTTNMKGFSICSLVLACASHCVILSCQNLWQRSTLASPRLWSTKCCPCSGTSSAPPPTRDPLCAGVAVYLPPPPNCAKPFMPRWGPAW